MLSLLLLLAAPGGTILEARLEATLENGPDVAVRLTYRVEAPGVDRVFFSALEIDGVRLEEVSAIASQEPLPVDLEPRSGPKLEGSIGIPKGTADLELRYVVRGGATVTGDGLRVRLPCPILDLKLEETRSGLFTSGIELPDGLLVIDSFPSQGTAGADGTYRSELPLVPAFVSYRVSSGEALLTPTRVATTAVVMLLLTMGVVGVRRARVAR